METEEVGNDFFRFLDVKKDPMYEHRALIGKYKIFEDISYHLPNL